MRKEPTVSLSDRRALHRPSMLVMLAMTAGTVAVAGIGPTRAAGSGYADRYEEQERARLAAESAPAAAALHEGEAALGAGDGQRAAGLLARARELAPRHPLPARRHCEVLTRLGRQPEAIAACDRARLNGGSIADLRATVAAYLARPGDPTPDDLVQAMHYAALAQQREPGLPHGAASRCDIARRIGDAHMLRACRADLQRLAPEHPETKQAAAAEATPWGMWLGLAALSLAVLGTLAHAWWRARRRPAEVQGRPLSAPSALVAVISALLVASSSPARADQAPPRHERAGLSEHPIDDANPEASVPAPGHANANPIQFGYFIQDLLDRADQATGRGDHAAAVRYYRAIVKAVPDRSIGLGKLCAAYEANGEIDNALKACGVALTRTGVTIEDHARFGRLMIARPGRLGDQERGLLQASIGHLRRQPGGLLRAEQLQCDLALKQGDGAMLAACTAALMAAAPDDARTIGYQWALAVHRRDGDEARRLLERARRAGVTPSGIAAMETLAAAQPGFLRRWGLPLALAAIGLMGVLLVAHTAIKRRAGTRAAQAASG
jgi:hypothetical protein